MLVSCHLLAPKVAPSLPPQNLKPSNRFLKLALRILKHQLPPPLPPPWTCTSRNPTPSSLSLSASHFPSLQTLLHSPRSRIGLETISGHFVFFFVSSTLPVVRSWKQRFLVTGRPCNSCLYTRIIALVSTVSRGWPLPTKPTPTFAQTCAAANWRESQLLFPSATRWSITNTPQALPFTPP